MTKGAFSSLNPCPSCGEDAAQTKDSRYTGRGRRRRKKCGACGHRWTTLEVPIELFEADVGPLIVAKDALDAALAKAFVTRRLLKRAIRAMEEEVRDDE